MRHSVTRKDTWLSCALKLWYYYYYYYRRFKKHYFYSKFSYCHNQVKGTMNFYRWNCLKTIHLNLKPQPDKFWKYVSSCRKSYSTSRQLQVNGDYLVEPGEKAFVTPFLSVYINLRPGVSIPNSCLMICYRYHLFRKEKFKKIKLLK
jgi:hypothetical protein